MNTRMIVTHASEHKWVETVTADPASELGKNNQARIRSTLRKLPDTDIEYTVSPLTDEILTWFTPLYQATIQGKQNAKVFDIYGTTLGKQSNVSYFALTVQERGEFIGATIFSERKHVLSIAYRIYPSQWQHHSLQAGPSLMTEYWLNEYAWSRGYHKISHGKDRNPYGLNSHIGLAIFKLSVGCQPYLPSTQYTVHTLDLSTVTEDVLVFHYPEHSQKIIEATLYCTAEVYPKYAPVEKYPDKINVRYLERPPLSN